MSSEERPEQPPRPCPICKKMSVQKYRPFCSRRCADIDLSRWFSGVYAAPADDQGDDETPPIAPEEGQS